MPRVWLVIKMHWRVLDFLRARPIWAAICRSRLPLKVNPYCKYSGADLRPSPLACSGFSVVEVLLAATVFGFLVAALSGAIIYGRSSTVIAGDRARANLLAEEGLEAVRNIRDHAYTNLVDTTPTAGLAQSSNQWVFSGASDVTGIYTRTITISSVDSTRKLITSTVTWSAGGISRQVSVSTYLTNWQATL